MPWGPLLNQPVYRQPILGHLWFLYYLLIYYAAAIAVLPLAARVPHMIRERMDALVRVLSSRWWGPALLAAVTTVTLLPMEAPGLDTAPALLPPPRVLVAYAVFFAFGWLLFRQRDLIPAFGARWKTPFFLGSAASAAYLFIVVAQRGFTDAWVWHLTAVPFAALAIWFLIFGITGFFVRHLEQPRPLVRYFSDASYWMYLTHAAPAAWLPGVLANSTAPAAVKFTFVVGLTTLLTVATYHVFVRSTVIGELLNGRRYPRRLPALVVS
jgi:peptidoglycan/LPS O-acetylase OafA/YrhL